MACPRRRRSQPQVLASRSDRQDQRRLVEDRVAPSRRRSGAARRRRGRHHLEQLPIHAGHRRRSVLRLECHRPGRSVRPEDGQDDLDAGAAVERPRRLRGTASRGVAVWQSGAERRVLAVRGEYLFALDAKTGKLMATFGDGGRVNLKDGLGPSMTRSPGPPRRSWFGTSSSSAPRIGFAEQQGSAARRRPGVRRAHRQAALDLPRHSARRASSATRPGKTTRGSTPATPTSGR